MPFGAVLIGLGLIAPCGCDRAVPSGGSAPAALPAEGRGPEVRVRLLRASRLLLEYDTAPSLDVVELEERRLVWRGRLPAPCLASADGGTVDLGGLDAGPAVRVLATAEGAGDEARGESGLPQARAASPPGPAPGGPSWSAAGPPPPSGAASFLVGEPGSTPERYRGALELHAVDGRLLAVNAVRLEDYLAGVVAEEMPAAWPVEGLKAQAVASRTYTLAAVRLARAAGRSALVAPDTTFQVYGGVAAEHPAVGEALRATRGEVLTWLGRIFRSYFHSTCGGQTARADLELGGASIPPLQGVRCGACDGAPFARWEARVPRAALRAALEARIERVGAEIPLGEIDRVEVAETRPDGRVRYVRIEHARGALEWRADRFRRELSRRVDDPVRSTRFRIESGPASGGIVIHGRGWGHGVGLCQTGSRGLAREGRTYREILGHYYPGAELRLAY